MNNINMNTNMNMNQEALKNIINQYLPIRILEKKQYGEVFTPPELIEEILDRLPREVFQNPNYKWLDPCSGIGNFMIILYFRLMKGLELWEPEEEKRSKHIMKNMLYMVELNPENVNICNKIFESSTNLIEGDFLETNFGFGIKFDIIIGNPPFQDGIKSKKGGKNKLYERILLKCLSIVKKYLAFIIPDNLFSGSSKTYLKLLENHIELISFNKSIQLYFPKIQEYMCYFLLNKKTPSVTTIIDNDGQPFECILSTRAVNPVRNWSQNTENMINFYLLNIRNTSIYNRGKTLNKYDLTAKEGSYELIYTPTKNLYTTNKILAVGLGIKKIVLFMISPNLEFRTDFEGKYGLGPNTFYIPIRNESEGILLEKFLRSDIYKELSYACKTSRQFLKIKLIEYINLEKIFETEKIFKI